MPKLTMSAAETSSPTPEVLTDVLTLWKHPGGSLDGDAVIRVGNTKVAVNKIYLASYSLVFHNMFFGDYTEIEPNTYEVSEVSDDEFIELLKVILPTRKAITAKSVVSLFALAERFKVDTLRRECISFLLSLSIVDESVPTSTIRSLALKYNSDELKNRCKEREIYQQQICQIRDCELYNDMATDESREFLHDLALKQPKLEQPLPLGRPKVFFDIAADEDAEGRILMELFSDVAPETAENFRCLCTGEKGIGRQGAALHYKGTSLQGSYMFSCICGGYLNGEKKTVRESIYGDYFDRERSAYHETGPGLIAMDPLERCSSLFIIYTNKSDIDRGDNVVFGRVVEGMEIVEKIKNLEERSGLRYTIADCGQID